MSEPRQSVGETAPSVTTDPHESWTRADVIWATIVIVGVVAAFEVPHVHLSWMRPVIHQTSQEYHDLGGTAPLLGRWLPHHNWSIVVAVLVAIGVILVGPHVARRAPWKVLVVTCWMTAMAWTTSLALNDGWHRGFVRRLNTTGSYLAMVPRVHGVSGFLQGFSSHILATSPHSWDIAVSGDPPGALLSFAALHAIHLSGPVWASALCVIVGSSAAGAVLVTIRALGDEATARRVAPFVALAPAAIWIGVSADAYFAGVGAWGLALLAIAVSTKGTFSTVTSVAAGVVLGFGVYLDYGMILLAIPALGIVILGRTTRPVIGALLGALVVGVTFTVGGFWWLDGLSLVRQRYLAGIAMDRPYAYWVWANLISLTCAIGLAGAIGLRRALRLQDLRTRHPLPVVLTSFIVVVLVADLTGLSKAETERIWLPFSVWLVAGSALLPLKSHRWLLATQALGALVISSLLLTTW